MIIILIIIIMINIIIIQIVRLLLLFASKCNIWIVCKTHIGDDVHMCKCILCAHSFYWSHSTTCTHMIDMNIIICVLMYLRISPHSHVSVINNLIIIKYISHILYSYIYCNFIWLSSAIYQSMLALTFLHIITTPPPTPPHWEYNKITKNKANPRNRLWLAQKWLNEFVRHTCSVSVLSILCVCLVYHSYFYVRFFQYFRLSLLCIVLLLLLLLNMLVNTNKYNTI